jgi:hypothetical protein
MVFGLRINSEVLQGRKSGQDQLDGGEGPRMNSIHAITEDCATMGSKLVEERKYVGRRPLAYQSAPVPRVFRGKRPSSRWYNTS